MRYESYGNAGKGDILLLHGGGLGPWNYREVAKLLCNDYRVILPVLDGHAGSDAPFTTIENNAKKIIDFIHSDLGGRILCLGGLSLGAQILVQILSKQPDICSVAFIESALVFPMKLTRKLARPMLDISYPLISRSWFAKLQFASLKMKKDLFDEYFRDTCLIEKESMIAFMQANASFSLPASLSDSSAKVHIFVGKREMPIMRRSAKALKAILPGSVLNQLPRLSHGEFSLNHPETCAAAIRSILTENT